MFLIEYILLIEGILAGVFVLLMLLAIIVVVFNMQPYATDIRNLFQVIMQNPFDELLYLFGGLSLILGGLLSVIGGLSAYQSPTQGISPIAYSALKSREIKQLQQARLSWISHNFGLLLLGIGFIIQGVVFILI